MIIASHCFIVQWCRTSYLNPRFKQASGNSIAYQFAPRRAGDIAECWADSSKAARDLGWKATRTVDEMTQDTWRWQSNNPQGYPDE
ncbi:UDP-glucose 4-epimerase [Vibrio scophthalmi]|nr:UDP-glucose 4-epimerase [Vibrio scophthalmi]